MKTDFNNHRAHIIELDYGIAVSSLQEIVLHDIPVVTLFQVPYRYLESVFLSMYVDFVNSPVG